MSDAIAAFIRTRLDEDEHVAGEVSSAGTRTWELMVIPDDYWTGTLSVDSSRVLAEVASKRAILSQYEHKVESMARYPNQGNAGGLLSLDVVLRLMASCWSDHPAYDPTWKAEA